MPHRMDNLTVVSSMHNVNHAHLIVDSIGASKSKAHNLIHITMVVSDQVIGIKLIFI